MYLCSASLTILILFTYAHSNLWNRLIERSVSQCLSKDISTHSESSLQDIFRCFDQKWKPCTEISMECDQNSEFPCGLIEYSHISLCAHSTWKLQVGSPPQASSSFYLHPNIVAHVKTNSAI